MEEQECNSLSKEQRLMGMSIFSTFRASSDRPAIRHRFNASSIRSKSEVYRLLPR